MAITKREKNSCQIEEKENYSEMHADPWGLKKQSGEEQRRKSLRAEFENRAGILTFHSWGPIGTAKL